eukprot:c11013_g1_i1.p1 GENE.c11013_g1_i1~~c11013_g1_i1.p1  ORF type:complete len:290 (-),score=43.09 c11013_g1_i1:121-990(-)
MSCGEMSCGVGFLILLLLVVAPWNVSANYCNEHSNCWDCESQSQCVWCSRSPYSVSGPKSSCHRVLSPYGCLDVDLVCPSRSDSPSASPLPASHSATTTVSPTPSTIPSSSSSFSGSSSPTQTPSASASITSSKSPSGSQTPSDTQSESSSASNTQSPSMSITPSPTSSPEMTCVEHYFTECSFNHPGCKREEFRATAGSSYYGTTDTEGHRQKNCVFPWDAHWECCRFDQKAAQTEVHQQRSTSQLELTVVGPCVITLVAVAAIVASRSRRPTQPLASADDFFSPSRS